MSDFLGIRREEEYSPGKTEDDRGILEAVAERLRCVRAARLATAEAEIPAPQPKTVVFAMCQGRVALARLRAWEAAGIRVINSTRAIENCHRERTIALLAGSGVPQPECCVVSTTDEPSWPGWLAAGAWVKRGDVHATQAGDVVRLHDAESAAAVCADFHRRGIGTALLQRHVEGEVVKFYAVRGTFFAAYAGGDANPMPKGERAEAIRAVAEMAAAALDLEIYGGDCVRDRHGRVSLIDVNDWPSYGRCRAPAAASIADYLVRAAASR